MKLWMLHVHVGVSYISVTWDFLLPSFFKVLIRLSDVEDVMLEDTDALDEELAIACSIKSSFLWSYKSKCNIDVKSHQDLGERSHSWSAELKLF